MAAVLGHWHSRGEWPHHYRTSSGLVTMNDGWRRGCRKSSGTIRMFSDDSSTSSRLGSDRTGTSVTLGNTETTIYGSVPVHVISYSTLGAVDGEPVTRDAVITNLPTPRSWTSNAPSGFTPLNNLMLSVTLGASGRVTEVKSLSAGGFSPDLDSNQGDVKEIMAAARAIEFQPAMRNGTPVSQQISILYRQQ